MGRNGSGGYSLPAGNPVVTETVISSADFNTTMQDLAAALTASIAKDGQTDPTANLPMATFRHTGVGAATALTDYGRVDQIQNSAFNVLVSVAGTVDAITASATPTPSAYAAGQRFSFVSSGANTGAVTLNVSGLGVKAVTKFGTTALIAGDIPSGGVILVEYDGTRFQIIAPPASGFGDFQSDGSVPMTGVLSQDNTTDSTSGTTGSIHTDGGLGIAKKIFQAVGDVLLCQTSGNVGIGTAPSYKLHVKAGSSGATPAAAADDLVLEGSGNSGMSILTPDANIAQLWLGTASDAEGARFRWDYTNDLCSFGTSKAGAELSIISGNEAEAVHIDSSGNVGINTSPSYLLDIDQSTSGARIANFDHSHATVPQGIVVNYSASAPNSTVNEFLLCIDTSATRLAIRSNGGIANFQANDVNLSDEATKENIKESASQSEFVKSLAYKSFNYIDDKDKVDREQVGLVAQDVEKIDSTLVTDWNDADPTKGVYTHRIQQRINKAVQESILTIEAQQAVIEALEARLSALESI